MGLLPGSLLVTPGTLAGQALKDYIFFPVTWKSSPLVVHEPSLALETGDVLLLENGDRILLES